MVSLVSCMNFLRKNNTNFSQTLPQCRGKNTFSILFYEASVILIPRPDKDHLENHR